MCSIWGGDSPRHPVTHYQHSKELEAHASGAHLLNCPNPSYNFEPNYHITCSSSFPTSHHIHVNLHPTCKHMHPTHRFILICSHTCSRTSRISQLVPQPIPSQALTPGSIPSTDSPVSPNSAISTHTCWLRCIFHLLMGVAVNNF